MKNVSANKYENAVAEKISSSAKLSMKKVLKPPGQVKDEAWITITELSFNSSTVLLSTIQDSVSVAITKTRLFKYIENVTSKTENFQVKTLIFF